MPIVKQGNGGDEYYSAKATAHHIAWQVHQILWLVLIFFSLLVLETIVNTIVNTPIFGACSIFFSNIAE